MSNPEDDEQPMTRIRLPDSELSAAPPPRRGRLGWLAVPVVIGLFVLALVVASSTGRKRGGADNADQSAGATSDATSGATASRPAATSGRPGSATPTLPASISAPPPPATTGFASLPLPASTVDTIPVGYPDTLSGAEAAAVNYAAAYGSAAMVNPAGRAAIVSAIADPSVRATLLSQLNGVYASIDGSLGLTATGAAPSGQTLVMRVLPVGMDLVSQSSAKATATVAVWIDALTGLAGSGSQHPVTEQWETLSITVHYAGNDWKWVGFTVTDGPVPVAGQDPSSAQALRSAANEFGGLHYAP